MIPQPKTKRVVDRAYLKWVKTKPCLVSHSLINVDMLPRDTCVGPIDPHHVAPRSLGGSDYTVVPLCRKHHDEAQWHSRRFQEKYALIFNYEIEQLNQEYKRDHPLLKRERTKKVRGYQKRRILRAWCVLTPERALNFPIFETWHEAQYFVRQNYPDKGKAVRVQIRIEGVR